MISRLINKYHYLHNLFLLKRSADIFCNSHKVKLYNWSRPFPQDMWLIDFIEKRGLLNKKPKTRIALYSVFGPRWMTVFDRADARIFVERENLHKPHFIGLQHRYLDDQKFQLSLGFDEIIHPQYMRFPFWLMWTLFPATVDYKMIRQHVEQANHICPEIEGKKFCAYVCSHDDLNRKRIHSEFDAIDTLNCPGRLFHNDDSLKTDYNDDKIEYLRHFKFNLTPENSDYENYVTEKLFEAIASGTVPIYNGSNNNPEPDIINRDAVIFIKLGQDNPDAVRLVRELHRDDKKYHDFACQPRYKNGAAEKIWWYYETLENKLREIIANI